MDRRGEREADDAEEDEEDEPDIYDESGRLIPFSIRKRALMQQKSSLRRQKKEFRRFIPSAPQSSALPAVGAHGGGSGEQHPRLHAALAPLLPRQDSAVASGSINAPMSSQIVAHTAHRKPHTHLRAVHSGKAQLNSCHTVLCLGASISNNSDKLMG